MLGLLQKVTKDLCFDYNPTVEQEALLVVILCGLEDSLSLGDRTVVSEVGK